jgi:hypothetical protein
MHKIRHSDKAASIPKKQLQLLNSMQKNKLIIFLNKGNFFDMTNLSSD